MKEKQILLSGDLGYINNESLSALQRDNKRLNHGTLESLTPLFQKLEKNLML
jgi:hypothetical protein